MQHIGGIQDLDVAIGSETVTFDEAEVTKEEIERAVTGAGYVIAG